MARLGTLTLRGASGQQYVFDVYTFDTDFEAVGAVYAITCRAEREESGYSHTAIYIGETGDLSTRFDGHHKEDCFVQHDANCKCIHLDDDEDSRLAKEADLFAVYDLPCND